MNKDVYEWCYNGERPDPTTERPTERGNEMIGKPEICPRCGSKFRHTFKNQDYQFFKDAFSHTTIICSNCKFEWTPQANEYFAQIKVQHAEELAKCTEQHRMDNNIIVDLQAELVLLRKEFSREMLNVAERAAKAENELEALKKNTQYDHEMVKVYPTYFERPDREISDLHRQLEHAESLMGEAKSDVADAIERCHVAESLSDDNFKNSQKALNLARYAIATMEKAINVVTAINRITPNETAYHKAWYDLVAEWQDKMYKNNTNSF